MRSAKVLALCTAIASIVVLTNPKADAALTFTGVNLSGADFGQSNIPGTFGSDYTYPTDAEVDYYVGKGMNTFRLPFLWERLQQTPNGAFDSAELARITSFVNYATSKGATVILDPHDYARYSPTGQTQNSTENVIGGSNVSDAQFSNFWSQLAGDFKTNSHVMFGLMNEPNTMDTNQWVTAANGAIAAIRATGANQEILVPGNRFTGAWTWNISNDVSNDSDGNPVNNGASNATALLNIVDPKNNFAIEVHQYLDSNGSGTSASIGGKVSPTDAANDPTPANLGVDRLTAFTNWLHAHNLKGFLGEFAVANSSIGTGVNQIGDETLQNMLNYMQANSDVWQGFTWWGGGPWWANNYLFRLDPVNGVDRAAMGVLQPYLAGVPEPTTITLAASFISFGLLRRRARA
jgi:endoglucanase